MKKKEIARPDAATPGQATETALQGSNTAPAHHSSIGAGPGQGILDLLQQGEAAAIPGPRLANMLGLHDTRALRSQIDQLRKAGAVICYAGRGGYFLPACDPIQAQAELEAYVGTQDRRLISNRETTKAARAMLDRLRIENSGQMHLEDGYEQKSAGGA